jgi:hypothetical protein
MDKDLDLLVNYCIIALLNNATQQRSNKMKLYNYTNTRGYAVKVPATLHKMIQCGISVGSVNGGKLTRQCKFTLDNGTPMVATVTSTDKTVMVHKVTKVAKPTKQVTTKVTAPKVVKNVVKTKTSKTTTLKSNADLCREHVTKTKASGGTVDDVVQYNVHVLGQPLSQAKVYAKACWKQVK